MPPSKHAPDEILDSMFLPIKEKFEGGGGRHLLLYMINTFAPSLTMSALGANLFFTLLPQMDLAKYTKLKSINILQF